MVAVHLEKIVRRCGSGRAGDEVVVDDIVREITAGIGDSVTGLVIVNDVVNENIIYLGERIAVMRAGKNVVAPGEVVI